MAQELKFSSGNYLTEPSLVAVRDRDNGSYSYNYALIRVGFHLGEKQLAVLARSLDDGTIIWRHDLSKFPALGNRPSFEVRQFDDINGDDIPEVALKIPTPASSIRLSDVGGTICMLLDGATGGDLK